MPLGNQVMHKWGGKEERGRNRRIAQVFLISRGGHAMTQPLPGTAIHAYHISFSNPFQTPLLSFPALESNVVIA